MTDFRDVVLTPEQPPALVPLADIKAFLGIAPADVSRDTQLTGFGLAAAAALENYCNTVLAPRAVVETVIPENDWQTVPLSYGRARALASVTVAGIVQTLGDYRLAGQSGILARRDGVAAAPAGLEVVISYQAGFAALPTDLAQAVLAYVRDIDNAKDKDAGILRENVPDVGDIMYAKGDTYMSAGPTGAKLPTDVAALVAPYVSWFRT
jgi:hypothetical protein